MERRLAGELWGRRAASHAREKRWARNRSQLSHATLEESSISPSLAVTQSVKGRNHNRLSLAIPPLRAFSKGHTRRRTVTTKGGQGGEQFVIETRQRQRRRKDVKKVSQFRDGRFEFPDALDWETSVHAPRGRGCAARLAVSDRCCSASDCAALHLSRACAPHRSLPRASEGGADRARLEPSHSARRPLAARQAHRPAHVAAHLVPRCL